MITSCRCKSNYELFFHCFNTHFPLCSEKKKKRITEFVSCFIGSLLVKVIKYRFVAPREGCYQDGCVSLLKCGPTHHHGK